MSVASETEGSDAVDLAVLDEIAVVVGLRVLVIEDKEDGIN